MIQFRRAKATDKVVDLPTFLSMQEWLERVVNMTTDQCFTLTKDPPNFMLGLRAAVSEMDYSDYAFGYKFNPDGDNVAEVMIYSGEAHHGKRGIIDVTDTKKILTVDHQYLWIEYVMGSGVATIAGPSTVRPVSDSTTFREWLYLFRLIEGVASLERVGHFGNILIPGAYA